MQVDLSILVSFAALFLVLAGGVAIYLSSIRLKGTLYDAEASRVSLDATRQALETDLRRMYDEIYRDKDRWAELNHLVIDSLRKKDEQQPAQIQSPEPTWSNFVRTMGVDPKIDVDPRLVFVLTPLGVEEQATYNTVRNVCQEVGLNVRRGDEVRIVGPILPHIIKEIIASSLIIANINGRNPNVFYELGIAQALGKTCLLIANAEDSVPFDVSHQQLVFYKSQQELRDRLALALSRAALGGHIPPRAYFPTAREQEAIVTFADVNATRQAIDLLRGAPEITSVVQVPDSTSILVKGTTNSKQFISDIGDMLRQYGVHAGTSTLISGYD